MSSFYYVYAVQARGVLLPTRVTGFDQGRLFTVPHRDLEAVVSEIDRDTPQMTEENVLQHEAVVEAVCQMGPAIPVRFGTFMRSPGAVTSALDAGYPALISDLERLGDKVEVGLTVLWSVPAGRDTAGNGEASDEAPGTRYLRAKLSQYRRDAYFRDLARELARKVERKLSSHVLESRCTLLPTQRLMMRAAYLLCPSDVKDFQEAFAELPREHPDLRFLLTGPWPPYSFVTAREADSGSELGRLLGGASRELQAAVQR